MKLHAGCVFWPEMTNIQKIDSPKEINKENKEILVVGGGISGVITAYRLSKEGHKVTLIEKEKIGSGSTSANTGLVQYMSDEGLKDFTNQIGKEKAVRFYNQSKEAIDTLIKIDKELESKVNTETFEVSDSLIIATDENKIDEIKEETKAQKDQGYDVEYLSEDDLEKLNIKGYAGLLARPDINLNPYGFVHKMVQDAIKKYNLSVIENCEFVSIDETKKLPLVTLNLDGKTIEETFEKVIFATGYNPPDFLRTYLDNLNVIKTFVVVTDKHEDFGKEKDYLLWELEDTYTYFKKTFDQRLMIGGFDEDDEQIIQEDTHKRDTDLINKTNSMIVNPVEIRPDFSYTALFGESNDNLPYMGVSPDNENIFVICGIGGNGTVYSTIGSEMALLFAKGKDLSEYDTFKLGR